MAMPIPPVRRSQIERRANSRALILDAAVRSLVEDGYAGATTVTIQARAGVSRGRLLHHFPSRAELLVAAAQHLAVERITDPEDAPPASAGRIARIDYAVDAFWESFHQPFFWAAMELWTASRTDETLRARLIPEERKLGQRVQQHLVSLFGPELAAHPSFEDVRELLLTSMRGLALTYAINPREPTTDPHLAQWKRIARQLLLTEERS